MLRRLLSLLRGKPEPEVTLSHPRLGPLRYEEGIWHGQAAAAGGVEITVAGTPSGPDERQVERLVQHLENFRGLEVQIHDFLTGELGAAWHPKPGDYRIQSLDFLWPKKDDYFMVYLKLEGDEHGLWKLEFAGGQPTYLSRDD
jgi:hypothetical protein